MAVGLSGKKRTDAHFQAAEIHACGHKKQGWPKKHGHQKRRKRQPLRTQKRQHCKQRRQERGHAAENELPRGMSSILHRIPPN